MPRTITIITALAAVFALVQCSAESGDGNQRRPGPVREVPTVTCPKGRCLGRSHLQTSRSIRGVPSSLGLGGSGGRASSALRESSDTQYLRNAELASGARAPASSPARHPSALRFAILRRDVGAVQTGRIADTRFPVRNAGRRTVHLAIEGECGCMTARGPQSLPAGGAGEIYVRFQPQALWSGKVEKVVTVTTDEPGHPETRLTLIADIIPYIRIGPQSPVVIRYKPGGSYARELTLTPRAGRSVSIGAPRNMSAGLVRARLAPPAASDRRGTYGLHLQVGPVSGPGDQEETLMLPTSDPHVPMLPVVVDIIAARGPVVSPSELFAPAIDASDRGAELTKLQVFTRSGQLHLENIDTGNRGLEARIAEQMPGRAYQITLVYTGGWRPGSLDTLLKIRTDDPAAPIVTVPFHILVR